MYICIVVFFALAAGFFIVFGINPVKLVSDALNNSRQKPQTIKRKIDEARDTQKRNFIIRQFHQAKEILMMTERADQYDKYCRLAALLAIIGAAGGILLQNLLLIPVLALMGLMIPLLYIRFSANSYQKKINREVETALSIINSSYIRTENLVYSVRENIENINPPVLNVFEFFLNQVDLINPSVELALSNIRGKIKNDVFIQWCDAMILCQRDRTAKHMLEPIVERLTDMRTAQGELEADMYNPSKTTMIMLILTLLNIPLLYFLSRSWFSGLFTLPGKVAIAIMAAAVLYAVYKSVKAARPLEYKRSDQE